MQVTIARRRLGWTSRCLSGSESAKARLWASSWSTVSMGRQPIRSEPQFGKTRGRVGVGTERIAERWRPGRSSKGIFDGANAEAREHVIELLTKAYRMEIEAVMGYIAASVNLDEVRAQEIEESLAEDIEEELGHARQFADRIKELYGVVPGSEGFGPEQSFLRPPAEQTDIVHVIRGVIKAETGAIERYTRVVEETDQIDPVTQDMAIAILRDEQGHRRLFEGFLREYEFEGHA